MFTDLMNLIFKARETVNTNIFLFGLMGRLILTQVIGKRLTFTVHNAHCSVYMRLLSVHEIYRLNCDIDLLILFSDVMIFGSRIVDLEPAPRSSWIANCDSLSQK